MNAPLSASALDQLCVDALRFLAIDTVQQANSGHPGLPLDAAPMAYILWTRLLKHDPDDPQWFDRDRFVLSAGHGSALLYSLLHLTGYALPMAQMRQFRQWGSITPGHPERGLTPGVELTTGPLGQGFANGVGMAMVEAHLAARFNRDGHTVIDHCTYGLVSDGDLMEGVAAEAASLAGHLQLGKLIYLYDDNNVTLSA
ncbi:MAG: transketolase, partial [Pseudomonadota bacterium]